MIFQNGLMSNIQLSEINRNSMMIIIQTDFAKHIFPLHQHFLAQIQKLSSNNKVYIVDSQKQYN